MTDFNHLKTSLKGIFETRNFQKEELEASNGFGDQYEVYKSKDFKMRLISDRGQSFIDLSSLTRTDWHDLGLFFSILKNVPYGKNEVSTLIKFLKDQYEDIVLMLSTKGWENTEDQIKKLVSGGVL